MLDKQKLQELLIDMLKSGEINIITNVTNEAYVNCIYTEVWISGKMIVSHEGEYKPQPQPEF